MKCRINDDHYHVRHRVQSVLQQRETLYDRNLATKLGVGVPPSGSEVGLRGRKRGLDVQRFVIELVGAENIAHVVSFDLVRSWEEEPGWLVSWAWLHRHPRFE